MIKQTLRMFASGVIIHQINHPERVFFEVKPDNYPVKAFRRHLCIFGGNWECGGGVFDRSPRDTVLREIEEEIVIKHLPADSGFHIVLERIRDIVKGNIAPFGDFFRTVPGAVFQQENSEANLPGHVSILSVWTAGLSPAAWNVLSALQRICGNLCTEGNSIITSLDEILARKIHFSWGLDQIMKEFWRTKGLQKAETIPVFPDILVTRINNAPLGSYDEYLDRYEVLQPR